VLLTGTRQRPAEQYPSYEPKQEASSKNKHQDCNPWCPT
jgi:hypothetical protein